MSTPKTQRTRNAILQSARRLIEQAGPEEWTMEQVAGNADVTRMTVYRYFPSRTELLIATVRYVDEVEGSYQRFEEAHQAASGIQALEAWIRVWANYVPRIAPVARALLAARSHDQDAAKAWQDRMAALRKGPAQIAKRLDKDGSLAHELDAQTAADLMWAIASVQVWDALTGDRGWSTAKYQEQLSRALRRILTEHG